MADDLRIHTPRGSLRIDPSIGTICDLRFSEPDRQIAPLHRAPWRDDPLVQADETIIPVERRLEGDFFCAPFAGNDIEGGPPHGWSANSEWQVLSIEADRARLRLARKVSGAQLDKHVRLSSQAPLLYQTHVLMDGDGGLPVAHHPMVRSQGKARLFCSPKLCAMTPDATFEPGGRSVLAYPQSSSDLQHFPAATGGTLDLTRLPLAGKNEDFAILIERSGNRIGWTALLREEEDDIVFFLKNPAVLPVTMLWYSNGARDHSPWNGRHRGVLGIEDGCAAGILGHRASRDANPVRALGVPTCLMLGAGRSHRIAHITGAIPRPQGWNAIADITCADDRLILTDISGESRSLAVDPGFLELT